MAHLIYGQIQLLKSLYFSFSDHSAFERREALSAKIEFLKYARGDSPGDNDPNTDTCKIEEGKHVSGDVRKENEPQTAANHGNEEGKPIGRATSEDTEGTDPNIAKYGNKEEKVKLYLKGVPELIGKKTVEKLFAGESESCKQLVFLCLVSHKNKSVGQWLGNTSASPWLDCEELGCV